MTLLLLLIRSSKCVLRNQCGRVNNRLKREKLRYTIAGVAVEFEEVCAEQEKQKKVEEAVAAAAAG